MSKKKVIKIKALDGTDVEFVDEIVGQGGIKDCYFSPDRRYAVLFYRDKLDSMAKERLMIIAGQYRERIFNQAGGEYWVERYRWVEKIVEHNGRLGVVTPLFQDNYFFKYGSVNNDTLKIKGKEKQGKWFASASNRTRFLDPREKGNWLSYFRISIMISRAVKRLHSAGLAHSDLSYKNVLIDPTEGTACLIDIDDLVVPGKYPAKVVGTPDFIAPEVLATSHLSITDSKKNLPRIETDRHALAVLIYMYLLYRHPLRGKKVHDSDPTKDDLLSMGAKALFIEHPTDDSNRPNLKQTKPHALPWADSEKIPYTVCGPYLKKLFDRAFIDGLHNPQQRPLADEWETALIKTVDLMQPCQNKKCEQQWFVFDNSTKPKCPFCGTTYAGKLPILNLYSSRGKGKFIDEKHRIMVFHNQYLHQWHVDRGIVPNERLTEDQRKPVGYFALQNGKWMFVNQRLTSMKDLTTKQPIPIGTAVEIRDGQQLLLSDKETGRLVYVQMVNG